MAISGGNAKDVMTNEVLREKYLYLAFNTESDRAKVKAELQALEAKAC